MYVTLELKDRLAQIMAILADVQSEITMEGKPEILHGKEYLKLTNLQLSLEPKRLHMHFEKLFNGDKKLSDGTNKFLNERWSDIYGELRPSIEEAFAAIYKEYAKRIFQKIPFKDIFLVQ